MTPEELLECMFEQIACLLSIVKRVSEYPN